MSAAWCHLVEGGGCGLALEHDPVDGPHLENGLPALPLQIGVIPYGLAASFALPLGLRRRAALPREGKKRRPVRGVTA